MIDAAALWWTASTHYGSGCTIVQRLISLAQLRIVFVRLSWKALLVTLLCTASVAACTAVEPMPNQPRTSKTAVELAVEPDRAEIFVDGKYKGRANGWSGGVMPIEPGDHRLTLKADGYLSQRFDITIQPGETYRLDVDMAPALSRPPDGADTSH
jgi:hypothetical protein